MDLSTMVRMQVQAGQLGRGGSSGVTNAIAQLSSPATTGVGQPPTSTNVKLSAYGQLKSAFDNLQSAASDLVNTATRKTASLSDAVTAAQSFVAGYNQTVQAIGTTVGGSGAKQGVLGSDVRATRVGSDLAHSLTSGTGLADLKLAGITQNADGSLALDPKALGKALQSNSVQVKNALTRIVQQVGTGAGQEVASSGNVGVSLNVLASREQILSNQQTLLQSTASAQNSSSSAIIAAYQALM
jgi:flagellar hook-associated protein 2